MASNKKTSSNSRYRRANAAGRKRLMPRKGRRRRSRRRKGWSEGKIFLAFLAVIAVIGIFGFVHFGRLADPAKTRDLNEEVLALQGTLEEYADREGILEYTPYLLAIMQVESGGRGEDVMQSSESLGLSRNSLDRDTSISQGCRYFATLLKMADQKECDLMSVIQAYNFGPGYLDYVEEHGGKHSAALAEEYAGRRSSWTRTRYLNPIAIARHGGWRYSFGNMFYADLVRQYLIL